MSRRVPWICTLLLSMLPAFAAAQSSSPATQPIEERIQTGRSSWAFSLPADPTPPQVKQEEWCRSPIDRFILASLERAGLKPAPPADKRTLIRRAYFDVIGLPPAPAEVDAFLADDSPEAFAKVVDHLLASPQYGERWARHWLDVVRYTDSFDARGVGSAGDVRFAWRYRDWVIKAFNDDLPYTQFILDQIAGDLLPKNADGVVATGMYVLGNWPGGDADREKMMTDIVDDQIDVTGRAFLGITLACARCHDHKFDPISQKDYYGLAGIFFSSHFLPSPGSKTSGSPLVTTPIATNEQLRERKEYEQKVATAQKQLDQFADEQYAQLGREALARQADYIAAAKESGSKSQDVERIAARDHLDRAILARWLAELSPRGEPRLLSRAVHNVAGTSGVDGWLGSDGRPDPCVIANSTDHPVSFSTLTIPAKSLSVHPGPKTGVAIGWRGPVSGLVQIRGRVTDGDPNCGDGIDWRIERVRAGVPQKLASGSFPNGGQQEFAQGDSGATLDSVEIQAGDLIQLTVFPKETYFCDSTIVTLNITEKAGEHRAWDLSHDVVPDVLAGEKGNPHADSYGSAGVWSFFEASEESGGSSLARELADPRSPIWAEARKTGAGLPPEMQAKLQSLSDELAKLKKNPPPPIDEANALIEGGVPQSQYEGIHDCHLMARGRYDRMGDVVPRGFPELLMNDPPPAIPNTESGRLELARWIASPQNPMTARVMINRIWQHHFGQGIVRTPNNFGKLGMPPTHPELLDYLAHRFIDSGWSIKSMHRMIMLSAAYQQSSEADPATQKADPDNRLFGRMNRQRLEAEPFRDALLAVTGSLDLTPGGLAFRDPNVPRRTIYLMTIRSDRSNYRTLFDAADPTAIVDQRIDSTVAPQALFLMNDPFVLARAKALAARIIRNEPSDDRQKIDGLYQLLYSRPATAREAAIGSAFVHQDRQAWERYCQILLCANEFVYVD